MAIPKPVDQQINYYLGHLSPHQKDVVLSVVKTFAGEEEYDRWKDKDFVAEMDRRSKELESGKVKGLTWQEVEEKVRSVYKNRKLKK